MPRYEPQFKLNVLDKVDEWDNIARVSREFGVPRPTIYKWQEERSDIEGQVAEQLGNAGDLESESSRKRGQILMTLEKFLPDSMERGEKYLRMLSEYGTVSDRKKELNAVVEVTLRRVVEALEGSDWGSLHPKDLSKIMTDLEGVREKLAGEPTIIIEERNKMKQLVIVAARDLFGEDGARDLAGRIQAMQEAEYEEVGDA